MAEAGVASKFGAVPHWAKAEIPNDTGETPFRFLLVKVTGSRSEFFPKDYFYISHQSRDRQRHR